MENRDLPAPLAAGGQPPARFIIEEPEAWEAEAHAGRRIGRYLAAVRRHKWLVALMGVIGAAAGVYGSRFVPLTYVAEATLWVQVQDRNMEQQGPIQSSRLLQDFAWVELLKSYAVLDPVVQELRLYLRHAPRDADVLATFALDSAARPGRYRLIVDAAGSQVELREADGTVLERAEPGSPLGRRLGFLWEPPASALRPGREVRFTVVLPRTAAREINQSLAGALARGGNFLAVTYASRDPALAAQVTNAVTRRFVGLAAELKRAKLVELRDTLNSQLQYAKDQLEQAEYELQSFRVQTITLPSDRATPVSSGTEATRESALSNFFDLKIERDRLQRDYDALARALGAENGQPSLEALSAISSVRTSEELTQAMSATSNKRAELRTLRLQYTDEHSQVRQALAELGELERNVLPRLVRALLTELGDRIAVMDGFVASASSELREIPPRAIEEARLNRSRASAERLYIDLRQRFENARLATETSTADVTLLNQASTPQVPASDRRLRVILLALAAGLGLGVAGAVLRERLDPRIRYPDEVTEGLRLQILGAIPDMSPRGLRKSRPEAAEMVEAMRGIRLALSHAYGSAGPLIVTVTSPAPADGKTYLTSRLAIAFADMGLRTVIVDADCRRGTQHRVHELDRTPGLTDCLSGRVDLGRALRRTTVQNLDLIPSGSRAARAPELLASEEMGRVMTALRAEYQVILVDSPPLGAGVDPLLLASITGHVLLVLRTGQTERELAGAKLAMLARLPVRVLGAVLNGVRGDYAYHYYSYTAGYETGREMEEEPPQLLERV